VQRVFSQHMKSFLSHFSRLTGCLPLIARLTLGLAGVTLCILGSVDQASAGVSATFQVRDDQIGSTQSRQTSPNFTVDSGVEPLVGSPFSATFQGEIGSPLRMDAAGVPVVPGGGGSYVFPTTGCSTPTNFSVSDISCSRAYKSLIKISGTRDRETPYIFINDNLAGTYLVSNTSWEKDVLLQLGQNTITIYGKNFCDTKTPPIVIKFIRARMGDTNDDSRTDDYDLSTFTRRWEKHKDCLSDFNRDQITDDYDLSLLASSWTS